MIAPVENDELAGLDFECVCEFTARPGVRMCDEHAIWAMVVSCGDSALFCAPHRAEVQSRTLVQDVRCSRHPDAGVVTVEWRRL